MATLSQLLAHPALDLRLVQAGPGDPELSWASTTELLDLGEHLEGGELVLTTGLALGADDPRWRDFVSGLSRARIAGIGFGVGVNHATIPAPLVAAASAYRVALVEVPPPVPFIAVSKAVATLLRGDEFRAAQRALRIHQRLLEGAWGPQSSAAVLASIAQATGRQLAVLVGDGRALARTAGFAGGVAPDDEVVPLDDAADARLIIRGGAPLGPEERAVIAAGAMVLGLEVRGERSADERERERWARLTDGLLGGELGAAAARLLDPDLVLPNRVRAVAVQGASEDVVAWRQVPRSGLELLVTAARDLGAQAAGDRGSPGVSLAWQLCGADGPSLDAALASIHAHGLDAVVGRAVDLDDAELSRRSAGARLGSLSPVAQLYATPRQPVVVHVEQGSPLLEALLASGARDDARGPERLARSVLGPLARSADPAPSDEVRTLRETLRALLEHHGRPGPAAEALGIHRNTLRDRVARLERLTGRRLDDADDRAELWLALRIEDSLRSSANAPH